MSYQHFALLYDDLMTDVPYENWLDFIMKNIESYGNGGKRLLDLGCGTGTLSIPLAENGYDVTGIDLSEEMLAIAQAKSIDACVNIPFYQQDMSELAGFEPFDIIGVFCDALNYLRTEEDVERTIRNIYNLLHPGGLLLFDVHSVYKMEEVFGNQTYCSNDEEISYIWNCFRGEEAYSVEHELTFFVKHNDLYERFDEYHMQRTFPIEKYRIWLEKAGFELLQISADFIEESPKPSSERIFFVARKK
ncbi:MAG TPA: class I SAM-dependent methyltransferase [Bacillus bacterium]|nr:class I SAM-dependent methyltransferase [Bacillus sp. (in: firmicutes)]